MTVDNNGPEAAYQGPNEKTPDTGEDHDSSLEQAVSEPKQGTGEHPADWNPPPGNPGSDQDAQTHRKNGGASHEQESDLNSDAPNATGPA
jgi:hypothetical protein